MKVYKQQMRTVAQINRSPDLSRDNMIRNSAEMKQLRSSSDFTVIQQEMPGPPELYVSNKFISKAHVHGLQGGGIQISKVQPESRKLQIRLKENPLRVINTNYNTNDINPGLRAYLEDGGDKGNHSMSTFHHASQDRLDTQVVKDLHITIATNDNSKRVHQETMGYNDPKSESFMSDNNRLTGMKVGQ